MAPSFADLGLEGTSRMTETKLFARPKNLVFLAHGCVD